MKYNYIVIGAGSAGAILATRLSEDPNTSVLLLEAGPDYPDIDSLPEEVKYGYKSTKSVWDSDHNWQYKARGTEEAEIEIPRGKVTGGSSAINGQIFLRGIPEDYDGWARSGNDEWSFQKLVPYFNMVETDTTYQDDPGDFHGSGGPIICHRFPQEEWRQGNKVWFEAWRDNGYPHCEDHNAPDTTGVGPIPLNNPNGIRWSTAIGYLGLSRHRLNLTIRGNATVKRILFDTTGEHPRATGVEAVSGDDTFVVEGEEIILSAGAIGSPQILMLSGVGPADHLREHGIETVINSPGVGQNLADHPLINMLWATKPEVDLAPFLPSAQLLVRYTAEGSPLENDMIVYLNAAAGMARNRGGMRGGAVGLSAVVGLGASLGLNLAMSKGRDPAPLRRLPRLSVSRLQPPEPRGGPAQVPGRRPHGGRSGGPPGDGRHYRKEGLPRRLGSGIRRGAELLDEAMGGDRPPRLLHRQDGTQLRPHGRGGTSTARYTEQRVCGWWTHQSCPSVSGPTSTSLSLR